MRFNGQGVVTGINVEVTHLSPVFSPAVANNPVVAASRFIESPSDNRDDVIDRTGFRGIKNTTLVVQKRLSINTTSDRSTSIDLSHHVLHAGHATVFGNGHVREEINVDALATVAGEGGAGTANVFLGAGPVTIRAKTFGGFAGAGSVLLAGVVWDVARFMDELVGTQSRSSVAGTSDFVTTVQNVLDGEIDINSLAVTGNLDTIGQSRQSTMGPAGATVLWDVLVQVLGEERGTVDVLPGEALWEFSDVGLRQWRADHILVLETRHVLHFIDVTASAKDNGGQNGDQHKSNTKHCLIFFKDDI